MQTKRVRISTGLTCALVALVVASLTLHACHSQDKTVQTNREQWRKDKAQQMKPGLGRNVFSTPERASVETAERCARFANEFLQAGKTQDGIDMLRSAGMYYWNAASQVYTDDGYSARRRYVRYAQLSIDYRERAALVPNQPYPEVTAYELAEDITTLLNQPLTRKLRLPQSNERLSYALAERWLDKSETLRAEQRDPKYIKEEAWMSESTRKTRKIISAQLAAK